MDFLKRFYFWVKTALLKRSGSIRSRAHTRVEAHGPVRSPYEAKNRKNKIKIKLRAHYKNSGPNPGSFRFLEGLPWGPIAAFRPVPLPFKNPVCAPESGDFSVLGGVDPVPYESLAPPFGEILATPLES